MIDARHEQVSRIVAEAMRHDGLEREAFLDDACRSDARLRADVQSLLAHTGRTGTWLDHPMLETWTEVELPERIAGYEVHGLLGAGGMGAVYRAEQQRPRRTVAIKLLRDHLQGSRRRERFELEAELLGRLHHPCIAQIYEAGTAATATGERPYFAMELVDGATLLAYAEERHLDVAARLALLARIADAVQHAHQRGIIHRDLKPSNILVTPEGVPKILDFGIARALDAEGPHGARRTETGQFLGTLAYMSPEQVAGEDVDARSDVHALGVIAYELLAGRLPYDTAGAGLLDAVHMIRESVPAPLGAVDRALAGDVEAVVGHALEKDPDHRYSAAAALADDLRRVLAHQPVLARRPTVGYLVRRFARRHRVLVGAGAAIVTILAVASVALVLTTMAAFEAEGRAERAATRAQQRFEDVRSLARVFLFDVFDRIADVEGTLDARRLLASTGLAYLDALAVEAGDDVGLRHEIAAGYTRLGDVQGNRLSAGNLGERAAALASYARAEDLLAATPTSSERDALEATLREHRAAMVVDLPEPRLALAEIERAIGLRRDLMARSATGLAEQRALHAALELRVAIAHLLAMRGEGRAPVDGDLAFATACEREADAFGAQLDPSARADPWRYAHIGGNPLTAMQRELARDGQRITEDPVADAERAVAGRRAALDAEPNSAAASDAYFESLMMLGIQLLRHDRPRDAAEAYARAAALADARRARDADDRDAQRMACAARAGQADALLSSNRPELALGAARASLALARPLRRQRDERRALDQMAKCLVRLDRFDDAEAVARERLDDCVADRRPMPIAAAAVGLADVLLLRGGDCDEARGLYARALDVMPSADGSPPRVAFAQRVEDLHALCAAGDCDTARATIRAVESR